MSMSLANAELAVMNLLWDSNDSMTAREIREQLYPDETRAQHGTVQRLLQRLEEKGFVERDRFVSQCLGAGAELIRVAVHMEQHGRDLCARLCVRVCACVLVYVRMCGLG